MLTRRDCLKRSALIGAVTALPASVLRALETGDIITRPIPKTGEKLPLVGLGTSATFRTVAMSDDFTALRGVLEMLLRNGGTVVDTAPIYGDAEQVCARIAHDAGLTERIFWATKVNVATRGGGKADPDAARAQVDGSLRHIGKDPLDLIQVHDVADIPTHMPIIAELKEAGKVRYIGTTATRKQRYALLEDLMRDYPIDFIGVDYAIDNRSVAERILPFADERGIAVLIYAPFGRSRLWQRVRGRTVPAWAREFGAESWSQFFIKYVAAHPSVTCVTPATSKPEHMLDNIGAAYGDLPDSATRRRMETFVDALPSA